MTAPVPRAPAPALELPTVAGDTWRLAECEPSRFTMIVFYRGLHCPICADHLRDLEGKLDEFQARGVEAIAVSTDSGDRARETARRWGLEKLAIGYDLAIDRARDWGIYVSSGRGTTSAGVEEPPLFNEPGLDCSWFVRPNLRELLKSLDYIIEIGYPLRSRTARRHALCVAGGHHAVRPAQSSRAAQVPRLYYRKRLPGTR